jgi:hypothetical protein
MKYIVGASIGGLFGISVPFMMDVKETLMVEHEEGPRVEESQPVEDGAPVIPIEGALILPDTMCGYIEYESIEPKEQAKECLSVSIPAVPAI